MSELFRLLGELWAERARVGWVALGVFWGTLGLGILLAFGQSLSTATSKTADDFGNGLLRLMGGSTTRVFEGLPAGRAIRLRPSDLEGLESLPGVRGTCHEFSPGQVIGRANGMDHRIRLAGVSPGFELLRNHTARPGGRFLNVRDFEQHRRVCFLGNRLSTTLFGDTDPIGRHVELSGIPLTVVGVGPPRITIANYNGADQDKLALPATTFQDLYGWSFVSFLWVGIAPGASVETALAAVRRALGARLRFDPSDEPALELSDYVQVRAMIDQILDGNRIFTLIVGILGLLVSVVGVTNVMLALVEERTRELGVQLALGARPRVLAMERLIEGVLVTTVGGLCGLAFCSAVLALLGTIDLPAGVLAYLGRPQIDIGLAISVMAILIVAGTLAGWVPARRVLRLDPAAILRDE